MCTSHSFSVFDFKLDLQAFIGLVQVAEDVDAQAAVLEATAVLKKEGVSRVIVQVEKDSLYDILALIQSTASSARFLPFTASSSSLWTSNSNH